MRRDRLTNIALMLPRSLASLEASRTASACTRSKARATSPISSSVSTSIGSTVTWLWSSPSLSLSCRTISGSRTPATWSASDRSLRSGRTIDRPTMMVNSMARARTRSTAAPTIEAEMIALLCSVPAREITDPTSCCSTEPIWARMVFDWTPYQSAGVVGSLPSDWAGPELAASDSACPSSAFAWPASDRDTLLFQSWSWADVAAARKACRVVCCAATEFCSAVSSPGPNLPSVSAAVRIARCSDASCFITETSPSTPTSWVSVASAAPSAMSVLKPSAVLIASPYFCATMSSGSWVPVAALRRLLSSVGSSASSMDAAACWVCAG